MSYRNDSGYVSVTFDDGATVPLSDAMAYGDNHPSAWPERAAHSEGFWSWAKGWRFSGSPRMERIGVGAYGDSILLVRRFA